MITHCPFCNEPMSYYGPMTFTSPFGKDAGEEVVTFATGEFCWHCGYRFDDDDLEYIEQGEYAFGDPYQVRAACDAGQLRLL